MVTFWSSQINDFAIAITTVYGSTETLMAKTLGICYPTVRPVFEYKCPDITYDLKTNLHVKI